MNRLSTAAIAALLPLAALAQECSNADFKGVYGALAQGSFISPPPGIPAGPTVRVGRVEVDGKGGAAIKATLSLAGVVLDEDYGGTYAIAPDCSATVTLLIPFPGVPQPVPFKFTGVLSDEGRQQDIALVEPPGTTVRITLRKQRKPVCSASDLTGAYALNMSGATLFQIGYPQGEFSRVGRIEFDGKGAFTATTQASQAGRPVAEKFGGTYAVDAACTFRISFSLSLIPDRWNGVIADGGARAYVMQAAPAGSAVAGTLTSVQ